MEIQTAMRHLLTFCFAFGMAASATAQSSYQPEATGDKTASAKVFAQLRDGWAHNLRDKRIDACVAEFAADGEFIQPDGTRVRGIEALHKLYEMITATFDSDLVFDSQRVESSDDLAYDSGTFREILITRASGKRLFSTGSYLTTYRRDKNGSWLITEQVWTGPGFDSMIKLDLDPHPVVALTFDDLPAVGVLPAGMTRTDIAMKLASELNANHLARNLRHGQCDPAGAESRRPEGAPRLGRRRHEHRQPHMVPHVVNVKHRRSLRA
jgi:ketosteroid isomerase-like protein